MADEALASVMAFTGATEPVARHLLQLSDNDTMQACQLFFEQPDIVSSLNAASNSTGPSSAAAPAQSSGSRSAGREDAQGVIHIDDSDDEGDVQMGGTPGPRAALDDDFEASGAAAAARSAQEDEDAAMARRLQEELYGAGGAGGSVGLGDDEVRAPIGRTTETLVAPEFGGLSGGMYAGGEDDAADAEAFLEEMRRRRREQQVSGAYRATRSENPANPFSQSAWDEGPPGRAGGPAGAQSATSRRLAELYRPPREILTHLDWDDTRDEGKDQKKWILVNLQDMADFRCQMLNRDVWKDEGVQEIIREKFLFLQYDKDIGNARQFIQLYLPNEQHLNSDIYPYIAVVDPRTGEQMKVWSGQDCPTTATDFKEKLQDFLERYRFSGKNPVATTKAPKRVVKDVDRMTEDEMLQLAMQNSLATANNGSGESSSRPSIQDPDELTKSTGSSDKGKSKAVEEEAPAAAPAEDQEDSAWAKIASDRPHSEPAAGSTGVTRIQFMSPSGKVVRRFAVTDPVRRLYEWLKAEPLGGEDKAGVEFEIKRVPQGTDLIVDLDKTIEEAGIKQSSLAVEFVG
ncbi:hypothetical protein MCOR27_007734 [Pyricularia oryzae]|uniref:UAS domain-containing protein n=1 Tax=Pyricularia grisea TaxID=148305 RepID=A0ABQ8NG25_PYRGI|nr:hypothetical protein MCOR01_002660 [Pyricularia oryzae]KAI6295512.1 hypothetical protein MCOR33_007607 [Pyricularia grisea]KAI6255970.1 hypothetical protein MCOR19_007549 [Pyricularia oryzae]KAI6270602.1 hypothetical protein MCOR26_008171 [Pyricularia oryzae]KAI6273728.1 hypothetical protein MCOR27_007734 [Pyricularia oryzae]